MQRRHKTATKSLVKLIVNGVVSPNGAHVVSPAAVERNPDREHLLKWLKMADRNVLDCRLIRVHVTSKTAQLIAHGVLILFGQHAAKIVEAATK